MMTIIILTISLKKIGQISENTTKITLNVKKRRYNLLVKGVKGESFRR